MTEHFTATNSLVSLTATLRDTLRNAVQLAEDGADAMASGEVNQAIGTMLPVADQLDAAVALHRTIVLLHRSGHGGAS